MKRQILVGLLAVVGMIGATFVGAKYAPEIGSTIDAAKENVPSQASEMWSMAVSRFSELTAWVDRWGVSQWLAIATTVAGFLGIGAYIKTLSKIPMSILSLVGWFFGRVKGLVTGKRKEETVVKQDPVIPEPVKPVLAKLAAEAVEDPVKSAMERAAAQTALKTEEYSLAEVQLNLDEVGRKLNEFSGKQAKAQLVLREAQKAFDKADSNLTSALREQAEMEEEKVRLEELIAKLRQKAKVGGLVSLERAAEGLSGFGSVKVVKA